MKQLFIGIVGHNGSGKTTIAQKLEEDLQINRVSGDDFRDFLRQHILSLGHWDISHPTELGAQLRPLTTNYRLQLLSILLAAGESVIMDGSGFTKSDRQPLHKLLADFPAVSTVFIKTTLPEHKLLERLEIRGEHWIEMYHDVRKQSHEPPTESEANMLLEYNQHNYDEIKQRLLTLQKS